MKHCTWEPAENILDSRLIEKLEEEEKNKPPKTPRTPRTAAKATETPTETKPKTGRKPPKERTPIVATPSRRSRRSAAKEEKEEEVDKPESSAENEAEESEKTKTPIKNNQKVVDNKLNKTEEVKLDDKESKNDKSSNKTPEKSIITQEKTTIEKVIASNEKLTPEKLSELTDKASPKLNDKLEVLENNSAGNNDTSPKLTISSTVKETNGNSAADNGMQVDEPKIALHLNGDKLESMKRKSSELDLETSDEPSKKQLRTEETADNIKESNGLDNNSSTKVV